MSGCGVGTNVCACVFLCLSKFNKPLLTFKGLGNHGDACTELKKKGKKSISKEKKIGREEKIKAELV